MDVLDLISSELVCSRFSGWLDGGWCFLSEMWVLYCEGSWKLWVGA